MRRPGRGSKLDPHKPLIKGWLETHHLSAQQVLQRLQTQGVAIGYTVVREYVRLVRPKPVKAFLSLHFTPGECMQVDWGSWGTIGIGATRRRLSFFAAVLGYLCVLETARVAGNAGQIPRAKSVLGAEPEETEGPDGHFIVPPHSQSRPD